MCPTQSQFRSGPGQRRGTDRGRRPSRRSVLVGVCLTLALLCGVTWVAGPADAVFVATPTSSAPTGLVAAAAGSSAVNLTWKAPTVPSGLTLAG